MLKRFARTLDLFPPTSAGVSNFTLYEDDGCRLSIAQSFVRHKNHQESTRLIQVPYTTQAASAILRPDPELQKLGKRRLFLEVASLRQPRYIYFYIYI